MQIHEITTPVLNEGIPGAIGGALGRASAGISSGIQKLTSPWQAAKSAFKKPVANQQTQLLTNKAYSVWKDFAQKLRSSIKDPAKLQAFDNRSDGVYEKNLLAFTQKNLLGGAYLPNLTNKQEILDLIHELSQPTAQAVPEAATSLAGRSQQRNAGSPPPAPGATPQPGATTPTKPAVALTPAKEKELFSQLVLQGTLAQNVASGVGGSSGSSAGANATQQSNGQQVASAQNIKPQLIQALTNAGVKPEILKIIGQLTSQGFGTGDPKINSTGNPAADALLISMGFQI
jgi:hypothetical protein